MNNTFKKIVAICFVIAFAGCKTPSVIQRNENKEVPDSFVSSETIKDTINSGKIKWKDYFKDPNNNELIIGEDSFARGLANSSYSTFNDILNNPRSGATDIGAYNWTTFD